MKSYAIVVKKHWTIQNIITDQNISRAKNVMELVNVYLSYQTPVNEADILFILRRNVRKALQTSTRGKGKERKGKSCKTIKMSIKNGWIYKIENKELNG
jgi:hypothetical protein